MENNIRTRIAPSPTGVLHIGTARVALFNWLYAKKYGGKFILRIEDTDTARNEEKYELDIEAGLSWLGLGWDEGPETPDNVGPYRQSERTHIYQKYAEQLVSDGKAYWCFCTPEELDAERKMQEAQKQAPKYSGKCRNLSESEQQALRKAGRVPALRFKVEETEPIVFTDLIKGKMSFDPKLIGDFIIVKPDNTAVFLFSNVIDDFEMKINPVIRGEDHISNTPKQMMLARALNISVCDYAHLPMILNSDRTKMSKRKNPVSVTGDFRDKGYLPEAMINFMVLLGWAPKKAKQDEIYSLEDLVLEFDLKDVAKNPAIFDQQKLDFFNGYYIRKMPLGELAKRCLPYLQEAGLIQKESNLLLQAVGMVQERMKKLSEVAELTDYFFKKPDYSSEFLVVKGSNKENTKKALEESLKVLESETVFERDSLESLLRALAQKINLKPAEVLWPIRAALSGKQFSPGTFELLEAIGKTESLERIKQAINMLQ